MQRIVLIFSFVLLTCWNGNSEAANPAKPIQKDTIKTELGNLVFSFIGHATLLIEAGHKVIYVDPLAQHVDFKTLPKADIILITHEHSDHLSTASIEFIAKPETKIIVNKSAKGLVKNGEVLKNGESKIIGNFKIEAIPAYNIVNVGADGISYHPKGNGNGYVINFGGKRIYISGDTEIIPEMSNLKHIDIAFLPLGLPYVMNFQMLADAARRIMPNILYPYHFDNKNPKGLLDLLKDTPIKIKIRSMN